MNNLARQRGTEAITDNKKQIPRVGINNKENKEVLLSLKSSPRVFAVCYYVLVFPWAKRRYHFFVKSLKKGVLELSLRVTLQ